MTIDRCTACLYGMVSRIIMLSFFNRVTALLPESEYKGKANVWFPQEFEEIFFQHFFNLS